MLAWVRRGRKWCQKESKGGSFWCILSYVAVEHILHRVKKFEIYCDCSKNLVWASPDLDPGHDSLESYVECLWQAVARSLY